MWNDKWTVKIGSREVTLCGALVAKLVTEGAEVQRVEGERWRADGTGLLSPTDVSAIAPVRGLTPTECDEHGRHCP
ncbi:hypothetical protein MYSTI_01943 [Myxococcus stipitatus DSM 14675]|uniref:Uncharacterized protein n=1 Tax=Myxococcus stipitatus (strain DSM 14675 / JCM 12634 / Mx s8) TaxID=1278073 RepID=L7U9Y4_MYXSD|nr:hypothetical protein [Myxococcus stipitatus]AGC43274.1 hypothetical protein MYSTI_01943 [Myxococcus stipitatus DSM 14675]